MKKVILSIFAVMILLEGCAMLTTWKNIPAPGGCDQCHTVAIGSNWKIAYQPAVISDERGRNYLNTPEYNLPDKSRTAPVADSKSLEELQCFECHKPPTPAHRQRKGRFHHQ